MGAENDRSTTVPLKDTLKRTRRRAFIKQAAVGATAAIITPPLASSQPLSTGVASPAGFNPRIAEAFELRVSMATQDALIGPAVNVNNGDNALYPDKGGTYTKGLPHDAYGRVNLSAFATFTAALSSGKFSNFENIIIGGTRTLNGPQAGLCFDLGIMDSVQFGQPQVPPAPQVAGDQSATELLEHYWASLLRDSAFTDYGSNALAAQAASELGLQPTYLGPRNAKGQVTPSLLFRGAFPGETLGPYISQFLLQPAFLGTQPVSQQQVTYLPNIDYVTDFASWLNVQNGVDTGLRNQLDPQMRFRRNGRDLAALTHTDVLFQEYF